MSTFGDLLRDATTSPCPGSGRCLLAGVEHEHVARRDPWLASLLGQVDAFRRAEVRHADGTWVCPGCGLGWDALPIGHSWSYADGGSCSTAGPVAPGGFAARGGGAR